MELSLITSSDKLMKFIYSLPGSLVGRVGFWSRELFVRGVGGVVVVVVRGGVCGEAPILLQPYGVDYTEYSE